MTCLVSGMAEAKSNTVTTKEIDPFRKLVGVCQKLETVIRAAYGPNGKVGLIIDSSGHATITTCGIELLQSVHFQDPCAQLILQAVYNHHQFTGDGSKEFILLLNELWQQINLVVVGASPSGATVKLRNAFAEVQNRVLPDLLDKIVVTNFSTKTDLKSITTGFFAGKFGTRVSELLSKLLVEIIVKSSTDCYSNIGFVVNHVLQYFDVICFCEEGGPLSHSVVASGILLSRNICNRKCFTCTEDVKFVLVKCALNFFEDVSSPVTCVGSSDELPNFLSCNATRLRTLFRHYADSGVQLIITSATCTDLVLHMSEQNNIAVVHSVEDDEIDFVQSVSDVVPVCTPFEILDAANIAEARVVSTVLVNRRECVQLDIPSTTHNLILKYLRLTGPTLGISKQYSSSIKNCLKCLRLWCLSENTVRCCDSPSNSTSAAVINDGSSCETASMKSVQNHRLLPVGGWWEFAVHRHLTTRAQMTEDAEMKNALKILAQAVLAIPRALLQNSFNRDKLSFVQVIHAFNTACASYIDGLSGSVETLEECSSAQAVYAKYLLLDHTLTLVRQLLKLDKILFVKPRISETSGQ